MIRQGLLVGFPTETVYGLGANALDATAVAAVFALKERPKFDPLIVHIADPSDLSDLVKDIPAAAKTLIERFWPGPLSLVLVKQDCVPDIVTAGLPSVAVRCPGHLMARTLIREAGVPIAAPSANRFGMVSPTTAQHVREQFGDRLSMVLDDGPCRVGVESTVISFVESPNGMATLLRPGGVPLEEIEAVIGPIEKSTHQPSRPSSPGQLTSHYAPRTPLVIADQDTTYNDHQRRGLLCLKTPTNAASFSAIEVLSESGCLRTAAVNLFAAMRRLDAIGLDCIIAEPVPEVDLGLAIMDRLRRAAAK
ncbi:Threonylcarbamoyl-AMP synthase [Stieleria varia]|uniref:Threonylcarbamoyl-AMP synthase n=2 Tax=Stieleria varia TaxID=2528005 RepID=A0A5C6B6F5_9BACT|nr:Threonylcarbamoyl-AMP synthase [Stieleria varia]